MNLKIAFHVANHFFQQQFQNESSLFSVSSSFRRARGLFLWKLHVYKIKEKYNNKWYRNRFINNRMIFSSQKQLNNPWLNVMYVTNNRRMPYVLYSITFILFLMINAVHYLLLQNDFSLLFYYASETKTKTKQKKEEINIIRCKFYCETCCYVYLLFTMSISL